jgi:hypothetical protein
MTRSLRLAFALTLLVGCDGGATGTDAGGSVDAGGGVDAGGAAIDAGGGGTDAGPRPDAGPYDAGIDCSLVACSPTPMCGAGCTAPCGCCGCTAGGFCADDEAYNCVGGSCLEVTRCAAGECAVDDSLVAGCAGACADLQAEYEALIAGGASCTAGVDSCVILNGHCSFGLGGCYHPVEDAVTQEMLDTIAEQWVANDCDEGSPVCDCPPPPDGAACTDGACVIP